MATFNNGESGLSVRTKLNTIINKVEGVTSIDNDIDVTGTVTADGLTVDQTSGYVLLQDLNAAVVSGTDMGGVKWRTGDSTVSGSNRITAAIRAEGDGTFNAVDKAPTKLVFSTHGNSGVDPVDRMTINSDGDISFYEDTGTTPKFFWDASAEQLQLGTLNNSVNPAVLAIKSDANGHALTIEEPAGAGESWQIGVDVDGDLGFYNSTSTTASVTFDDSGSVGIGTSSPISILETYNTSSAAMVSTTTTGYSGFRARSTSGNFYYFIDDSTGSAFGTGAYSRVLWSDGAYPMVFGTNATERMRIDSSGNVLVGKTTDNQALAGVKLGTGGSNMSRDNEVLVLNRLSTDGTILNLKKDGTTVGSIGSYFDYFYIGSPTGTDAFIRFGDSIIAPSTSGGAYRDAAIDLGVSTARFKDLYLSGGVYLGGTGAANKLDDYETGTWTPSVAASAGTITTVGTVSGFYTKVGRLVTIHFSVAITSNGTGSGFIIVTGIPFVPSATTVYAGSGIQNTTAKSLSLTTINASSQTYIRLYDGTYPASSGETLRGSVTYMT